MDDISDQRPAARRMRLGTKSCAECRRRKVRCVFPPNSSVCQGCSLHQTLCRAQQPRARDGGRQSGQAEAQSQGQGQGQSQSSQASDQAALKHRVVELESLIRSLCDALEPEVDDGAASIHASADIGSRASQVIQQQSSLLKTASRTSQDDLDSTTTIPSIPLPPSYPPPSSSSSLLSPGSLTYDTSSTSSCYPEKANTSLDAPLIHLFRDAMLIHDADGQLQDDPEDTSLVHLLKESVGTFKPPIPDAETLQLIFQDAKIFWPIWPPYYHGPDLSTNLQTAPLDVAQAHLIQTLTSGRGPEFVKALLWLSLCIQQLPKQWQRTIVSPSIPRPVLIDSYLRFASVLLSVEGEDSIHVVQCYLLLYKLLINVGRPQRAWVNLRRAVSAATIIGLNRLDANASGPLRKIWAQVWHLERHMSVLLGFPSAITTLSAQDQAVEPTESHPQRIARRLSIIAGSLIERNQTFATASYATTVQIDQEMEELRDSFPPEWWGPHSPNAVLDMIYYQEVAKVHYFILLKLLHLPYMLKSRSDRRYEHSRLSTMEACRELIRGYLRLRDSPKAELIQCELMDFQAFSAAVTLILGILSEMGTGTDTGTPSPAASAHLQDWQLVEHLITALQRTSVLLECNVAKQSAHVLAVLVAASYGTYNATDEFTLVVPYFGRLRINQVGSPVNSSNNSNNMNVNMNMNMNNVSLMDPSMMALSSKYPPAETYMPSSSTNTIEFSGTDFFNTTLGDFDFEMDLGQDWSAIGDAGVQYDWNQIFSTSIEFR